MSPTIRDYRADDLESCRELWRDLTQRHRDIYDDQRIGGEDPGVQFDEYLARDDLVGPWVLDDDGEVIGLTGLLLDGKQAEIEPVVVKTGCRSRGLGTQLLQHARAEAVTREVTQLSIRPVARNVEAIACFHRAGFTILGRLDLFVELSEAPSGKWKPGVDVHGRAYRY